MSSQSRLRIFILSSCLGGGAQMFNIVLNILSIPIGISYFGPERYGIWLVLISMLVYLNASQFGIGTATSALMAKEKDSSTQQKILFHAFALLAISSLCFVFLTIMAGRYPKLSLLILGKISPSLEKEVLSAAFYLAILFFIKVPTIAFTSAFIGLQEIYWERFYTIVLPAITGFISLLITIWISGDLLILSIFTGTANLIISIISVIHVLVSHKCLLPSIPKEAISVNSSLVKEIIHSGWRYLVIGIAAMVVWNTDNLIINHFQGPEHVSAYAVTFKLFTVAYAIFFIINSALWPMYGKVYAENDWEWLRKVYGSATMILPVIGGLVWISGILFAQDIIALWVGVAGYGGTLVVFALGGYGYTVSLNSTHASLLGGLNATNNLLWVGILEAIVNFALSLILINFIGIGGVALGTFLASLFTVFWLLPKDVSYQTNGNVSLNWSPIVMHSVFVVIPFVAVASILNGAPVHGWICILSKLLIIVSYILISWRMVPSNVIVYVRGAFAFKRLNTHIKYVRSKEIA